MNKLKKPLTLASTLGALLLSQNAEAFQFGPLLHPLRDPFFTRSLSFERTIPNGMTMYEKDGSVVVEAPLPGLSENDVEITLDKDILSIQGKRSVEEAEDEETKYYYRSSNNFSYHIGLPDTIDQSEPEATFKNGMLRIVFDKKAESQPRRINLNS